MQAERGQMEDSEAGVVFGTWDVFFCVVCSFVPQGKTFPSATTFVFVYFMEKEDSTNRLTSHVTASL